MKAPGERGWRGGREMEENGKGEGKGNQVKWRFGKLGGKKDKGWKEMEGRDDGGGWFTVLQRTFPEFQN